MGVTRKAGGGDGATRRFAGSETGTARLRAEKRKGGEEPAGSRAGKPDSQEPHALAAADADGSRDAARERTRLAEYVYADEGPGGIADPELSGRDAGRGDCGGAAGDCGIVDQRAVFGMERGHQHFGVAVVSAGDIFPAASDERTQMPGSDTGGPGVPRHDADYGGARGAAQRRGVSTGDVC